MSEADLKYGAPPKACKLLIQTLSK